MDRFQEKQLELLVEFHTMCEHWGLKYFLGKDTALCAARWHHFPDSCHKVAAFMPHEDYLKFEKLIRKEGNCPKGRSVESLFDNPNFNDINLRYVNTDTTCLNLAEVQSVKQTGVSIAISALLPYNDTGKMAFDLKRYFAAKRKLPERAAADKIPALYNAAIRAIESVNGIPLRKLYESACIKTDTTPESICLQAYSEETLCFKPTIFEERTTVELEGHCFYIPKDFDPYLSVMHGRRWNSRDIGYRRFSSTYVIDLDSPFSAYADYLAAEQADIQKLLSARSENAKRMAERLEARRPIEESQRFYYRAKDRVACEDHYLPIKDTAIALYRKGAFKELARELIMYQEICEKYISWEMPFAFDQDYYYMMCDVFNWQGLVKPRRIMLKMKGASFEYINSLPMKPSSSQPVLDGSPYAYIITEHHFKSTTNDKVIEGATADEIDELNAIRRSAFEEEPVTDETVESNDSHKAM